MLLQAEMSTLQNRFEHVYVSIFMSVATMFSYTYSDVDLLPCSCHPKRWMDATHIWCFNIR